MSNLGFFQGMREGGWPMWVILVFGLLALGAAALFVMRPERRRLGFIKGMALATLASIFVGFSADLAQVFHTIPGKFRDSPDWYFFLLQGLGESMTPGVLGFPLLSLTALLVAVGMNRMEPHPA